MKLVLLNRNGVINENPPDYAEPSDPIKGISPCGGCRSLHEKHK